MLTVCVANRKQIHYAGFLGIEHAHRYVHGIFATIVEVSLESVKILGRNVYANNIDIDIKKSD